MLPNTPCTLSSLLSAHELRLHLSHTVSSYLHIQKIIIFNWQTINITKKRIEKLFLKKLIKKKKKKKKKSVYILLSAQIWISQWSKNGDRQGFWLETWNHQGSIYKFWTPWFAFWCCMWRYLMSAQFLVHVVVPQGGHQAIIYGKFFFLRSSLPNNIFSIVLWIHN